MSVHFAWVGGRRSALAQLLALIAVGLVSVLSRGPDWIGSWKMALDWGTFSLTLVGPVASGIACAAYARIRNSGADNLMQMGDRPWWAWTRPAFAVWTLGAGAMLTLCLGTTTAASIAGSSPYPSTTWVVLPALCVLAAQVSVGALFGGLGGRPWLTPVAAAATFALGILTAVGLIPGVFRTGGVSGSLAGETFQASSLVLQAMSAVGICAALLLFSKRQAFTSSRLVTGTASLLIAGGVAAYVGLGVGGHERYTAEASPDFVCRGDITRVCMARETTRPLDDIEMKMRSQSQALIDAGAELPGRFVQSVPGVLADQSDGVLQLFVDEELSATVSDAAATESLTTPAACPQYSADTAPPESVFDARRLLGRWLRVQADLLSPTDTDVDSAWLTQSLDQQAPWVKATYEQLRECNLGAVGLPDAVG